ncbi:MAG: hypothetical protein OXC68_11745 [Aestuariivita sp.]|nr:hypothetical protein [Aestuariivita sp.]
MSPRNPSKGLLILSVSAIWIGGAAGVIAEGSRPAVAPMTPMTELLAFIRSLEAPRGYTDYERRIALPPPRPLTQMRIADVLAWQRQVQQSGAPSTAAGGYQLLHATLKRLVQDHAIDPRARFDAPMQDQLARLLIAGCGPYPKPADVSRHPHFGTCLAGIWAALPRTSGRHRGRSVYQGVAGNTALTTPETVLALLAGTSLKPRGTAADTTPHPDRSRQTVHNRPARTLAFGAVRVSDARQSMHAIHNSSRLTPSVHHWAFDPYAQE